MTDAEVSYGEAAVGEQAEGVTLRRRGQETATRDER